MSEHLIVCVLLIVVLAIMSRSAKSPAPVSRATYPAETLEMHVERSMEESSERVELDQAVDRMRGRIIITDQPATRMRGFDRELDGVGTSLNATF